MGLVQQLASRDVADGRSAATRTEKSPTQRRRVRKDRAKKTAGLPLRVKHSHGGSYRKNSLVLVASKKSMPFTFYFYLLSLVCAQLPSSSI